MENKEDLISFLSLTEGGEIDGYDPNKPVSIDNGVVVSRIQDDEWNYNQYNKNMRSNAGKYTLKWKEQDHNPLLLKDLRRRADYLFNYDSYDQEDDSLQYDRKGVTKSVIVGDMEKALTILSCFKDTNVNNLGALSHPIVWGMVEDELRKRELAPQSIEGYLTAICRLMDVNKFIPKHEHFIVNIARNELAAQLAAEGKQGKGSTPTIIPEVYSTVLAKVIDTIEKAHENIDEWSLTTQEYALKYEITALEAYTQKKLITAVCFNSCIAFTGCRISELVTFHHNSYHELDVLGIIAPMLSGSTSKLESGIERDDIWCCAPICKKAIEVIHSIWKKERMESDNINELPAYTWKRKEGFIGDIGKKKAPVNLNTSNMNALLELASEEYGIVYSPEWDESYESLNSTVTPMRDPRRLNDNGVITWHFSTHTWRRSFAHFGVGNGIVSLASVKQQFKHLCISMTGIYSASADVIALLGIKDDLLLKKEIDNARKEYNDEYLSKTFSDDNMASGGFAKTVLGDISEPMVVSEEKYQDLVKNSQRAARSTGYARCFGEEKCDLNHVFEPSGCIESNCSNLCINDEEAARWKERHRRMSASVMKMLENNIINPNVFGREISDIRAAEKILTDHGYEFTKFEGALPVCQA